MSASQQTELQIFSGGLNFQTAPHLLALEQSRYLANADIRRRNLTPLLAPLFQEVATGAFVYSHLGQFKFYNLWRSNVLFNRIWYSSDISGFRKEYVDGKVLPLGIAPPTKRLTIAMDTPTEGDGLTGIMTYVYTYYDTASGGESPPSPPSNSLDLTGINKDKAVTVSSIVGSPDGFETRIYRLGGNLTLYSAVVKVGAAITEYFDQLSFSEIEGNILDTYRAYPPQTGTRYLTQHQGRFFGALGSRLQFTPAGNPDSWFALDFIGFEEIITSLMSVSNGLSVTTKNKTWIITGNSPQRFAKHIISESEGCIDAKSVAINEGKAIWLSATGFVMSNGGGIINISVETIGRFKSMTVKGAAFLDKRYYMAFSGSLLPSDTLYPSEVLLPGASIGETGVTLPAGMVLIDFATGNATPAFSTIVDDTIAYVMNAQNEVYQISEDAHEELNIVTEDGLNNMVTEGGNFNIIAELDRGKVVSKVIGSSEYRTLHYTSPVLTNNSIGTYKQYEKIRITYSGELEIKIYNDNFELMQTQVLSSRRRVSEWVGIPVKNNRGYGIQFNIVGKCVVDSLLYTWTPQESQ